MDVTELELALERLDEMAEEEPRLRAAAGRATAAILDVIAILSPEEIQPVHEIVSEWREGDPGGLH